MKLLKHLKTVHTHRKYVRRICFKMGIPLQGLVHDLSKYSITELKICKYYVGNRSPHQVCREQLGYSPCWIHHYHRNKHHWEYWLDNSEDNKFKPIKMPYKYVIESVCDMIGASKAYNGKKWNKDLPAYYWIDHDNEDRNMHMLSLSLARLLIFKLSELGEKEFYKWYKKNKKEIQKMYNHEGEDLENFLFSNFEYTKQIFKERGSSIY